jgi:uncharacterized protein GlcG (DUF336 family)
MNLNDPREILSRVEEHARGLGINVCAEVLAGAPAWGFGTALAGDVIVFGGGVPRARDVRLIGGLGVRGSSVENDAACARAGATEFDAE